MPFLTSREVRVWADENGYSDMLFSELDYRLVQALDALYQDDFLAERLYMKGGTAINKLYLGETSRLSVDLDFNHIGPKESVLKERPDVRKRIIALVGKQDKSYIIHSKRRYEQTTIKARYKAVTGPTRNFKIEISHVERFPILNPVQKQLRTPTGHVGVTTYKIEELTATKLRALLERLKGRDVYDLFYISQLKPEPNVTRKMFLYYFYRSRKVFNPRIHYRNLTKRYNNESYVDDVSFLIKPTIAFSLQKAARNVISQYAFLSNLDKRDEDFLSLARLLLDKKVAKERLAKLKRIKKPLEHLFAGIDISKQALEVTADEIRLFRSRKRSLFRGR